MSRSSWRIFIFSSSTTRSRRIIFPTSGRWIVLPETHCPWKFFGREVLVLKNYNKSILHRIFVYKIWKCSYRPDLRHRVVGIFFWFPAGEQYRRRTDWPVFQFSGRVFFVVSCIVFDIKSYKNIFKPHRTLQRHV